MKRLITTIFAGAIVLPLSAAVVKVTNNDDAGAGSFRDAVQLASSGDTLELNVSDTIRLDSVVTISKNLVITKFGKGEDIISGQGVTRVLHLTSGNSLEINDLTICNGFKTNAAGIYSEGDLTLKHCLIKGNNAEIKGAGVYLGGGTNTIIDCTFEGNRNYNNTNFNTYIPYGGGLFNGLGASTIIDRCTFDGNSCRSAAWTTGGAIGNEGILTVSNSTIVNNTLESTNSLYQCIGAGIGSFNTSLTVTHCTIANNNIINGANTGAGIAAWQSGAFNINNSIIYGNTYLGTTASDIGVGQGSAKTSLGNNLIGAVTQGFNTVASDIVGQDPLLESYGLNGGVTKSYTINCSSPAYKKGSATSAGTTGQNGITRGNITDIGSYTWVGTLPSILTSGSDATCPNGADAGAEVTNVQLSYTYVWSTGDTSASISNVSPGTYIVTATDQQKCSNTDTIVLGAPSPMTFTAVIIDDNGSNSGEIELTVIGGPAGKNAFLWTPGDSTTQNLRGVPAGTYTVTVTDSKGCTADSVFTVGVVTGVETYKKSAVTVFPNPAKDQITIDTEENILVELFDLSGNYITSSSSKIFDLAGLSEGVYLLNVIFTNDQIDPETLIIYVRQ